MVHTARSTPRRRGGKKIVFLVHFFAPAEFDLPDFILKLKRKHSLTVLKEGSSMRSIMITLSPFALRRILEDIPRNVQVAYEEKEPEKC